MLIRSFIVDNSGRPGSSLYSSSSGGSGGSSSKSGRECESSGDSSTINGCDNTCIRSKREGRRTPTRREASEA